MKNETKQFLLSHPTAEQILIIIAYLVLTIAAAGLFGAIHDQISYTVSPEYYTQFKFYQFNLHNEAIPERIRAAQVGFLASWWMGIPLGLLTCLAGFIHKTPALMRRALLWSLPVIIAFVLAVSLCGLVYGFIKTAHLDMRDFNNWIIPHGVINIRNFLCVGTMHEAAYFGGALSITAAWTFHFIYRWWYLKK
ncbi:MAG: hypothetical protein WCO98_09755 [bacterium]